MITIHLRQKKEEEEENKGGKERRGTGGNERGNRDSLVVRIPLSQSAFMDNEKKKW